MHTKGMQLRWPSSAVAILCAYLATRVDLPTVRYDQNRMCCISRHVHQPSQSSMCMAARQPRTLCSIHIEGWWSSGCRSSVAEHWRLKPEVSLFWLPMSFGFFTFLYFLLMTSHDFSSWHYMTATHDITWLLHMTSHDFSWHHMTATHDITWLLHMTSHDCYA